jgi:putative pyruvate formate lyase activating enzyme
MASQPAFEPGYLALLRSGELEKRAEEAVKHLADCDLCPWDCRIDRLEDKIGFCKTGRDARISSAFPHRGEEDPLSGRSGSGTIFFSYCNLRCQYCQNYTISQEGEGHSIDAGGLAVQMLTLQAMGCHNINFVSPSHVVAQIIEAVAIAAKSGLRLPLVYNTGGYDSLPALELLDGIVDIYMPDMKYGDPVTGQKYSKVKDYTAINQAAVREMHRQVGDLKLDERGIAQRGLLIRHRVLPGGLAGTEVVARFLAGEISKDTYINIMGQYRPEYRACREDFGDLSRAVTVDEIAEACEIARTAGLHRFDQRRRASWLVF